MAIFTFVSTSARFAVAEYEFELEFENVPCTEREYEEWREKRYLEIKERYTSPHWPCITSEEFFFMYDYEEEQWRNSEAYAEAVEWLANPANRSDINYSDIYKDVYGHRPRW